MKTQLLRLVLAVFLLGFIACEQPKAKTIATAPQISFVRGSTYNRLEVLDWGGEGRNLLFLAGLGNSAHVFNDFAPKFTDSFHVYALTRRGFGASAQTVGGYDIATLAKDILVVIDSLHLQKVILIGHSIAGDEISKFASTYPERVEKVVYLDAAYDRIGFFESMSKNPLPPSPEPTSEDQSSVAHLNAYLKRTTGVSYPEDEIKQYTVFSKDGFYSRNVTSDTVEHAIVKGLEHPDYTHIKCPALAIYSNYGTVQHTIVYYDSLAPPQKKQADAFFSFFTHWQAQEEARFKKEVPNGTVKEILGANHYLFISNGVEVERVVVRGRGEADKCVVSTDVFILNSI